MNRKMLALRMLLSAMLVLALLSGAALAETKMQGGTVTAIEGTPGKEGKTERVDGTFTASYRLEYALENGRYRLLSFEAQNLFFAGVVNGDFVYRQPEKAEPEKEPTIDDAVKVSCILSADGLATVTFSYQLKRVLANGDTLYLEPMTTTTTFQVK